MGKTANRTNYLRRGIGVVLGGSPVLLLLASLLHGLGGHDPLSLGGLGAELLALLVGGLNLYLSFFRGALYRWTTGSLERYRHVSGLPMLGTLLVVIGVLLGFGSTVPAVVGLAAIAADTGRCGS